MTHQIDVLSAQKCSYWSRCVRARIVVVKSDLNSAVGFPNFLEDNWLVYHSELTVQGCSTDAIATCPVFPKKQASCASNFCWIWLFLKHLYSRLRFTFGLIGVDPWFITSHDVIDVFRSISFVVLENFFRPIDMSLFFERLIIWLIVWK